MLTATAIERRALQTIAIDVVRTEGSETPAPFFSDLSAPAHIAVLGRRLLADDPEHLNYVFLLDAKQKLFAFMGVQHEDPSLVVRDVFRFALLDNAAAVVFCTLRTSGCIVPRAGDHALSQALADAAETLGVRLFDHLVIDASEYYSFRELGIL